jgi:hypothetical protein
MASCLACCGPLLKLVMWGIAGVLETVVDNFTQHVGMMLHVGPSFVLYARLVDPGCCPKAHFELDGQFESEQKKEQLMRKGCAGCWL